jgi:hypothetical protein
MGLVRGTTFGRAHGAGIQFTPSDGFVCDSLDVDVGIDASVTDLRGFHFVFEFDPAAVEPVAVSAGSLVQGAGCGNFFVWLASPAGSDSVAVDGATLGCSVAGPGAILRLRFAKISHGTTSDLACRRGVLRDAQNHSIPFTCHAGSLTTCPPVALESRRWEGVKRLYR